MADIALRRYQIALEGPYTSGVGPLAATQLSTYNGLAAPVAATRRLSIEKGVGLDHDFVWESPVEARGTYSGRYQTILHQVLAKGKLPAFLYADDLAWLGKMLFSGTPTVLALPSAASPGTNVLSAGAIPTSAGAVTGTITNPNTISSSAGALLSLQMIYGTTSATAQSFTIVGTSVSGAALTETVSFPAGSQSVWYNASTGTVGGVTNGTWAAVTNTNVQAVMYTQNYFATVTSITSTATAPASSTLNVGAVFGFQWNFLLDMAVSTLYSATGEYYDGTVAWQVPGMVAEKFTLTAGIGKTLKSDTSFSAKNKTQLAGYSSATGTNFFGATKGSLGLTANTPTYNPYGTSYGTAGSIPVGTIYALGALLDNVLAATPTYAARVFAVNIGSDPGTGTNINARLTDYKFDLDNKVKLGKAADGTANPNYVGRDFYGEALSATLSLLFNESPTGSVAGQTGFEVTQFFNQQSRTVRVAFPGVALPCGTLSTASSWPTALQDANSKGGYYGIWFDLAGKYTKIAEKDVDGRMALDFELKSEADLTFLQAPAQVVLINRVNPQMAF